ncbi:MAG: hypothetical protein M3280_07995 [Actinomycetota bacterium]|nr:hypothetical protein [Actinomycetota bacterium]
MALILVALLALAACGDDNGDTDAGGDQGTEATDGGDGDGGEDGAAGDGTVAFTAVDFAFQGPSTVPAGEVEFTMENTGKEPHMLALAQLDEGKTVEDVQAYIEKEGLQGPPPPWAKEVQGGIQPVKPGETGTGTATLKAGGYYVALCFIQSKANNNQPHAALGMIAPIQAQ